MDLYYKCVHSWSKTTNMMTASTIGAKFVHIGSFHEKLECQKQPSQKPKL